MQDPDRHLCSVVQNPSQTIADDPLPKDDPVLSDLQSGTIPDVETLEVLRNQNGDLRKTLGEASSELETLRKERFELDVEIEISKARVSELVKERSKRDGAVREMLGWIRSTTDVLKRITGRMGEEESSLDDEFEAFRLETRSVREMSLDLESKFVESEEMRRKEKKELENSIVSLTEENRDINSLLRIALVEKEAVENSLSRMKGSGEQKRVAFLQIAERGLQRVGFGFMMGGASGELHSDQPSNSSASTKFDGSECEEEVVSVASTVEKLMKNLRLEISSLKLSLDESRSDAEQLQILVNQQAEKIKESTLYIKELDEREQVLAHNVEELTMEITEAGEEVARWREACEMEVEAGEVVIEEHEKEIAMLREVLKRTNSALDAANSKLALKERLAATAMAAQAAAEASLQLADSRSTVLRERIEELMQQVEEEAERTRKEKSKQNRRKLRHVCWPWQALKLTPARATGGGGLSVGTRNRRMMPDMEALLSFI